ncbi:Glutathionyl-hydroquinone reductase [Sphingopyxis fribergensis]|uniref:Glutathionyl-hydroquinone reductase n=1 Tax=Sphingopyxis fribergensis TaxID=1515612 RepID=A0A0A7PHR8_9SPHN|nr:glutathione S-transferase family protein [Sphingopyxis fribergensis]AJA09529.1 Glutathionyl-hydroquinone reductase [Sphingopyxis fribergensis]
MGMLVGGRWSCDARGDGVGDGTFRRSESLFRDSVTRVSGRFAAADDRYHLYVSLACPWAHRVLIMRALKGLDELLPISIVNWLMLDGGWSFEPGGGVIPDPEGASFLHEIYTRALPTYTGKVTVPVLWDKHTRTIVNNESSEILRMLNDAFDDLGAKSGDYYPAELRTEIDALNARIYPTVNNGVYRAGFATTQQAYDEAVGPLFESLDWLEDRLSRQGWLVGDRFTEADIRLFTTLIRFDAVYHGHFKCNLRRIEDYPHLSAYTRRIASIEEIAPTIDMHHIKHHYYNSQRNINPSGIVPRGPVPRQ